MLTEIEYLGSDIKTLNDIGSFQLNTQNKILKDDLIFKITGAMDGSITEMFMTRNFPSSLSLSDVTYIGGCAFYECSTLTSISFPQCSYIGAAAFMNCKSLCDISFPQCSYIGEQAFRTCTALTSVRFPQCSYIGEEAFYNCTSLHLVNFSQCNYIGQRAFEYCSDLTYVSFPQCSYIGSYAFYGCSNLRIIILYSNQVVSLASSNAFSKTNITSTAGTIQVPASLRSAYKVAYGWSYFSNIL